MKSRKPFLIILFVTLGTVCIFFSQGIAKENPVPIDLNGEFIMWPDSQATLILADRGHQQGQSGHGDKGCKGKGMGHRQGQSGHGDKGCKGKGMGHQQGQSGHGDKGCKGKGMGHRGGMHHGMGYGMGRGPGLEGEAQCPQTRSTAKAPELLFSKTNPLESTTDNIEKGRMLFQLDAQPTCTICHGSGNGLGMMSGGLNPPPRNFTCKETMDDIPDGQLFWIIRNGSAGTGMPAFSDLNDDQIWQLIHYIRQFSQ